MFGSNSSNKGIKIFLVDDEPMVLEMVRSILRRRGYQVTTFENADEALARIKAENVDLVITDLRMPGMDGIQFICKAKQVRSSLPIILFTSYPTIETAVQAIKYGGWDYLSKTFDSKKICEAVDRALLLSGKQA